MKRRDFLRRFGISAAAVVAAPSIIKAVEPEPDFTTTRYDLPNGNTVHLADINHEPPSWAKHYRQYPMTYEECYTDMWQEERRRQEMAKHWPKLVKRYGKSMSITDFVKLAL
jgi:hypothetical protein